MKKNKKLILFGDSAFAEIAYEYFKYDSEYEPVAFAVSKAFLKADEKFGLPVIPFEEIEKTCPPETHEMHVALVYNNLNRNRAKFYQEAKAKGYLLANYVSSKAFVWRNVSMGDNVFVFENNVIQPFVKLGSNLVFWSGNHIGHHSVIKDHCFISSHVVVSGFCEIGESCFFGVNSTIANNVIIGRDCLIGSGAMVVKNIENGTLLKGLIPTPDPVNTYRKFGIPADL